MQLPGREGSDAGVAENKRRIRANVRVQRIAE
jgi:hypothetical protein